MWFSTTLKEIIWSIMIVACVLCAYLQVYACCLCVPACKCMWRPQVSIKFLPLLPSPLFFETGFGVANSVVMTSQWALRSFCICYLSGEVADVCHCVLSARDPNSNPHGCMISTLADMPSFQPNCKHSQRI